MVLSAFMNTDKIRGCCICWLRLLCRKYPLLSPVKGLCQGIPATRAAQDLLNYMFRRSPKKEHYRMLLPREFIAYLSRELVKKLTPAALETSNPQAVAEIIGNVITEELAVEDRLNDEVRDILQQYSEYMRREGVSYQEMFRKVKNTMIAERKVIRASGRDTHDPMKLSRDKITDMSHKIVTALRKARELRMKRDHQRSTARDRPRHHRGADRRGEGGPYGPPEDPLAEARNSRRQRRVGSAASQILLRRTEKTGYRLVPIVPR